MLTIVYLSSIPAASPFFAAGTGVTVCRSKKIIWLKNGIRPSIERSGFPILTLVCAPATGLIMIGIV